MGERTNEGEQIMVNSMNNYILRVYRLNRKEPNNLVGLLEEVGVKEKRAFTNLQEIWDILSHPKSTPDGAGRRKEAGRNKEAPEGVRGFHS